MRIVVLSELIPARLSAAETLTFAGSRRQASLTDPSYTTTGSVTGPGPPPPWPRRARPSVGREACGWSSLPSRSGPPRRMRHRRAQRWPPLRPPPPGPPSGMSSCNGTTCGGLRRDSAKVRAFSRSRPLRATSGAPGTNPRSSSWATFRPMVPQPTMPILF